MDAKSTMLPSLKISAWSEESLSNLTRKIIKITPKPLILVDGVAGSGKTTIAKHIADKLNANIVHTDDLCWGNHLVHWDEELLAGIINPWLNGNNVVYRPTSWIKEKRSGSIEVDSNKALLIEGMGACRKTLRSIASYSIWIDTEPGIARERGLQRDLANGENGGTIESVTAFADWWDSMLTPLYLKEKPWEYVDLIISGSQSNININNLKIVSAKAVIK